MTGSGRGEMGSVRIERERSLSLGRRGRDERGRGRGRGLAPSSSRGSIRSWLDRGNRTVEDRSPQVTEESDRRNVRPRLNEFDLGEKFAAIEQKVREEMGAVVDMAPVEMKECMRKGLEAMVKSMNEVMNSISDGISQERLEREAAQMSMEDRVERIESKVEELKATADSLTRNRIKARNRESIKEMESKVREAQCALKLLDIDIERATDDKREIVRKTITKVRSYCAEEDKRA